MSGAKPRPSSPLGRFARPNNVGEHRTLSVARFGSWSPRLCVVRTNPRQMLPKAQHHVFQAVNGAGLSPARFVLTVDCLERSRSHRNGGSSEKVARTPKTPRSASKPLHATQPAGLTAHTLTGTPLEPGCPKHRGARRITPIRNHPRRVGTRSRPRGLRIILNSVGMKSRLNFSRRA